MDIRNLAEELAKELPYFGTGSKDAHSQYVRIFERILLARLGAAAHGTGIGRLVQAVKRFLDCENEGATVVHPGTDEDVTRLDVGTDAWEELWEALGEVECPEAYAEPAAHGTWTKERPTRDGYYWLRVRSAPEHPEIVRVVHGSVWWFTNDLTYDLGAPQYEGAEWLGPLSPEPPPAVDEARVRRAAEACEMFAILCANDGTDVPTHQRCLADEFSRRILDALKGGE